MSKFREEIGNRYSIFFRSDNSNKAKFGSKSSSDNINVKM